MIKFGYTIAYVCDVQQTLSFFEQAFGMQRRMLTPENDYGELDTGDTVLAFAAHSLGAGNLPAGYVSASDSDVPLGLEVVLVCDDLETAHTNALAHGATELSAPVTKPWGQTVSYVRCPSGLLLELCTPMGA